MNTFESIKDRVINKWTKLREWFEGNWALIGRIDNVATILGFILAVYLFYFGGSLPIYDNTISFEILEKKQVSFLSEERNFETINMFDGKKVNALWKYRIAITSKGNTNIIGKGLQNDLIEGDFISYVSSYNDTTAKILKVETIENQPEAQINHDAKNFIKISFSQWQPKEKLEFWVFIDTKQLQEPYLTTDKRQVTDWVITEWDYSKMMKEDYSKAIRNAEYFYKYPNSIFIKIFSMIAFSLPCLVYLAFFFGSIKELIGSIYNAYWDLRFGYKFNKKLRDLNLSEEDRLKYQKRPYNLPDEYWNTINLPKPMAALGGIGISTIILIITTGLIIGVTRLFIVLEPFVNGD